jgi:hypothetical protein
MGEAVADGSSHPSMADSGDEIRGRGLVAETDEERVE